MENKIRDQWRSSVDFYRIQTRFSEPFSRQVSGRTRNTDVVFCGLMFIPTLWKACPRHFLPGSRRSQATKIYHAYSLPAIVVITVEKPQSICLWRGAFIISCFPDYISLGIFSLWANTKNCKAAFILFYFSWFGLKHSNNKWRPLKRTTCFSDQSAT